MTGRVVWHYRLVGHGVSPQNLYPAEGRVSVSLEEARAERDRRNKHAEEWGHKPVYRIERRRNTWNPVS